MTHNEFVAVTLAVALFAGGEVARRFVSDDPVFDDDFYSRRDSLFFALSELETPADTARSARTDSAAAADTSDGLNTKPPPAPSDGRININRASLIALTTLPGIGPRLAERIVAYRQKHGPFRRIGDLTKVSGIGPRKLEALTPLVVVDS